MVGKLLICILYIKVLGLMDDKEIQGGDTKTTGGI